MIAVDKYIRKLLFEYDCVIIPEFGGLLTHHIGVQYDAVNQKFSPAGKRLAFNEVLKMDDGLLSYCIAIDQNISIEEATGLVLNYVHSLRQQLHLFGRITLFQIGNFSTNAEGKLVFEPDYTQNFDQGWYGLASIEAKEIRSENTVNDQYFETEAYHDGIESLIPLRSSQRTPSNVKWVAAAMAGVVFAVSMLYKPINTSVLSSLNPLTAVDYFVSTADHYNNPQLTFTNKDVTEVVYFEEKKIPPVASPNTIIANADSSELTLAEVPVEPVITKKYFLIAGSYKQKKRANQLLHELQNLGFSDAKVLSAGKGKYIKVASAAYASENAAYNDKKKLDKLIQVDSWVFKK